MHPTPGQPDIYKNILLDLKEEIYPNIIIVGSFNAPLLALDRSSRQKISKETLDLNRTIDLTDIYRMFHPTASEYTFSQWLKILFYRS